MSGGNLIELQINNNKQKNPSWNWYAKPLVLSGHHTGRFHLRTGSDGTVHAYVVNLYEGWGVVATRSISVVVQCSDWLLDRQICIYTARVGLASL